MQGLVNFAGAIGAALAVLLPAFCYLSAIGLFLYAGWGFWMLARPDNPFRHRPWLPVVALLLCGVCASFDRILTMANVSAGSSIQVTLAAGALGYTPSTATSVLGNGPGDTVVNVVQQFQGFFQAFGAMACFFAVMAWRSAISGRSERSQTGCGVQFAAGITLINILAVTQSLVALFQTQ
jgi:hypothetical protein